MKTYKIYQSKHYTYINDNGVFFRKSNRFEEKTFTTVEEIPALHPQKWQEFKAETFEGAYSEWAAIQLEKSRERRAQTAAFKEKMAAIRSAEWDSIKNLEVIPATAENIRIILQHLNGENWGVWTLPKMSIGYSAHQYDCDGVIASTITLDRPIKEGKKFVVGAPRGYLNNYNRL